MAAAAVAVSRIPLMRYIAIPAVLMLDRKYLCNIFSRRGTSPRNQAPPLTFASKPSSPAPSRRSNSDSAPPKHRESSHTRTRTPPFWQRRVFCNNSSSSVPFSREGGELILRRARRRLARSLALGLSGHTGALLLAVAGPGLELVFSRMVQGSAVLPSSEKPSASTSHVSID